MISVTSRELELPRGCFDRSTTREVPDDWLSMDVLEPRLCSGICTVGLVGERPLDIPQVYILGIARGKNLDPLDLYVDFDNECLFILLLPLHNPFHNSKTCS